MASKRVVTLFSTLLRSSRAPSSSLAAPLLRPYPRLPRTLQPAQFARRYAHQIPRPGRPSPPAEKIDDPDSAVKQRKQLEPHYELTFTCVPCSERSTHTVSKQGYHKGSVLITCPSCRNRHVISDHLNIFGDRKLTVEDLMKERGQLVKRGTLGVDGDIEFWEDGTQTERGTGGPTAGGIVVADQLAAPSKEEESSTAKEAHDPSAAAPVSPTVATMPPLTSGGARPQLNSAPPTTNPPPTRRQFHSGAPPQDRTHSDVYGVDENELFELRSSLRNRDENPKRIRRTTSRMDDRLGEKTPFSKGESDVPVWTKIKLPLLKRTTESGEAEPSPNSLPPAPSKIPKSQLAMLRRSVNRLEFTGEKPLTPISIRQMPNDTSGQQPSAIRQNSSGELAGETWDVNGPALIRKQFVKSSKGRPNLRNPEARKFMGVGEDEYKQMKLVYEQGRPAAGASKWPQEYTPAFGKKHIAPDSTRIRFVNTGLKFQTERYHVSPSSMSPADVVEQPNRIPHTAEPWSASLPARMHRLQKEKGTTPKTRTVYAWPEGATEAVKLHVDADDNIISQHQGGARRVSQHPMKAPQFRKLMPKQKPRHKDEAINPDNCMAEMMRANPPQRPLPEETYERITKGVESARHLPPQKVHLEDFDIYGLETKKDSDHLI